MNCTGKSVCLRQLYRYFVSGLQGNNCINESAYFTEISHLIPLAQHDYMFGHEKTHKVFFKPLKVLTQHNSTIRSVVVVLMNMKF